VSYVIRTSPAAKEAEHVGRSVLALVPHGLVGLDFFYSCRFFVLFSLASLGKLDVALKSRAGPKDDRNDHCPDGHVPILVLTRLVAHFS
jgi:hypothetical protein